jgi:hypothetical protein
LSLLHVFDCDIELLVQGTPTSEKTAYSHPRD